VIVMEELIVGDQPLSIWEANKKCPWDPKPCIYEIFVLKIYNYTKSTFCTQKCHKVLGGKLNFFLIQLEANLKLAAAIMNLGFDSEKLNFSTKYPLQKKNSLISKISAKYEQ